MSEAAHYELHALLGVGGMGRVYRGVHRPSGTDVAVKLLHPDARDDPMLRRLFLDEATAAAKVDDPRIVQLLDLGRDADDFPFLVMELAHGRSIEDLIERWAGFHHIAAALVDALRGLAAAHAQGVVHRDLKPANILVEPEGPRARILDFGVAALNDPLRGDAGGPVVGTPEYMPPEQLLGQGPYGPWTDLYAIGVVLAQLVRGRSPFADAASLMNLLVAKSQHVPVHFPPREGLTVPDALQDLIERLIRPHPRQRPRFAIAVAEELEALAAQVVDEMPEGTLGAIESASSTMPTIVGSEETSGAYDLPPLPFSLPAPPNLRVGAALARLREQRMVGRDAERTALAQLADDVVADGHARLVAYVGEAGIGKSRLARWGLTHVERNGLMEGAAGGYDASGADIGGGLRHALRWLVGLPREGWTEAWRWFADEEELDLDRLRQYLKGDEAGEAIAAEQVVQLAHATLRAVGRIRPIYLWLDDLAWAGDGAIALVERLLREDDVPVLVVATMRPGATQSGLVALDVERALSHERAQVRHLRPLDEAERAELLAASAPLAPGIAETLAERIEGSPLLLVQLVRDWLETGLLEPHGEVVRPRGGASVDELLVERPLSRLLLDRIEGVLSAFGSRRYIAEAVLGRAALLGARVERSALLAACARAPNLRAAVDEVLERALLLGVLRTDREAVYAFDHGLLHEAMVEHIEGSDNRAEALIDAANGLQQRYGKERPDISMRMGDLLWRAGERERAWDRLLKAIERAAWAGDDFMAVGYVGLARSWASEDDSRLPEVEHAEALAHYYALRYEPALEHVRSAGRLAAERGDEAFLARCRMTEAEIRFYQDRFLESERLATQCHATESEDPDVVAVRAKAAHLLADLAVLRGDVDTALARRREAVDFARRAGVPWRMRVERMNLAETYLALGRLEEAEKIFRRVHAEAKAERDDVALDAAEETWARIGVLSGRYEGLADYLERRVGELARTDTWRCSGMSAFRALLSAHTADEATLRRHVEELEERYRQVPHEELATLHAMRKLAEQLEERGQLELARRVDGLLEARAQIHARGFAE